MDDIDQEIIKIIKVIDKRGLSDFFDALEEFGNTCDKNRLFETKIIIYLESIIKAALFELILLMNADAVKTFLTLACGESIEKVGRFLNENSGEEDEE